MTAPLILYSTNTWLSFVIAQRFYGAQHYVWCTPYFDPRRDGADESAVPPTSSPLEIYRSLAEEVRRGDRHSSKIKDNRVGILRGASAKRQAGIITEQQEAQIASVVNLAESRDFRPLLFVIPYTAAATLLREPPPEDKAHPMSAEFVADALPRTCFDVIDLGDVR